VTLNISNKDVGRSESHVINVWLEPGKSGRFELTLENPFNKKSGAETLESRFSWTIGKAQGFVIDY